MLAREVLREAQRYIASGASPVELKRGMDTAVEAIVGSLHDLASDISSVDEIANIASISANNDRTIGSIFQLWLYTLEAISIIKS